MIYHIPPASLSAYLSLAGITMLVACVPIFWVRKLGLAATLTKSGIAAALVLPLSLGLGYTITQNELHLSGQTLRAQAEFFYEYSRNLDEFDLEKAQFGTYDSIGPAQLKWRQNGLSMPGISAGHFSTTQGGKVFAILTNRSRVLYLPAKTGQSLLVSVEDPAAALQSIREHAKAKMSK